MAETKLGFQIGSALDSGHLTDAKYIQGGYIAVDTKEEMTKLKVKTATNDGVIIKGSIVYVGEEDKTYKYNGNFWAETTFGSSTTILDSSSTNVTITTGDGEETSTVSLNEYVTDVVTTKISETPAGAGVASTEEISNLVSNSGLS